MYGGKCCRLSQVFCVFNLIVLLTAVFETCICYFFKYILILLMQVVDYKKRRP